MCCKEYGHDAQQCHRDPNFRNQFDFDIEDEDERLENLTDIKKLNSDSQGLTMKMLQEFAKAQGKNIMSFDDFQYQNINQYILDLKLKPKKVKQQKSSSLGSSLDGSISDSDDEDSDPKVVKRE